MISLLEDRGFKINKIISSEKCNTKRYIKQLRVIKLINCLFKHLFEEFAALQYHISAYKVTK